MDEQFEVVEMDNRSNDNILKTAVISDNYILNSKPVIKDLNDYKERKEKTSCEKK